MPANQTKAEGPETAVKVLLYDLETSPNTVYTWGVYEQNAIKIIRHRQIIAFAWKWLGDKKTQVKSLRSYPGYKKDRNDNAALMADLHKLLTEADVVVGHNSKRFDTRRSHTDFIRKGMAPVPVHKAVDTCEFARAKFDFNSNKLDDLGEFLGVGRKFKHPGFEMWEGCMAGDDKSWDLMEKYNAVDVELLEKIYLKLRPWMSRHPSLIPIDRAVFACPYCKGTDLAQEGHRYTKAGRNPRYRCKNPQCGKWSVAQTYKGSIRIQ